MADETAEHRAFVAWFQTLDMQQRINVWYDCEAQTAAEVRGYLEGHLGKLQAGESRAQAAEQQVEQLKADLSAALRLVELRSVRCTCHSGPLRAGQVHADWCALRQSKDSSPAGGAPVPRTAPHRGDGPTEALRREIVEALREQAGPDSGSLTTVKRWQFTKLADKLESKGKVSGHLTTDPAPMSKPSDDGSGR
ncbi:MAG TPA: hypothetical protein VFD73_21815 [Gemmatimonadales bacterium]|nr:hypothetical protein [Gemmatimonadales bacterium]